MSVLTVRLEIHLFVVSMIKILDINAGLAT
jgi:hypothetical protein